jgi:hypothetical protein
MLQSTNNTAIAIHYFFSYLFIFTIKSVAKPAQSLKKAKRPRIVMTLEMKLKIIADFEAGK